MGRHHLRIAFITLIVAAAAACGTGIPSAAPSPSPRPAATSFEEYAVSFCSAWEALFRAVGNPDTAAGSVLSKALDEAVTAKNGQEAERLATEITAELESGRRHAAVAGGWPPAAPAMTQMDRLFVGFEAMIAAKAAASTGEPSAVDPQAAFEQAGGLEAYFAMIEAMRARPSAGQAGAKQCPNLPVGP